jgi:hypothetical protein
MIRTVLVSKSPNFCAIKYIGSNTPTAGNILVDNIQSITSFVFFVGEKAKEYAAGTAIISDNKVAPNDVMIELNA